MFSNLAGLQFFTPLFFSFSSSYQGGFEREERWREGWMGNLLLRQHLSTVPNTKTDREGRRRLQVHARQGADSAEC